MNAKTNEAPKHEKTTRHFTSLLGVKLTKDELLTRGKQLADIENRIAEEALRAEGVKRDLKAKEASLTAERSRLAGIVSNASENREIDCSGIADFERGVYFEIRMDTGEVLPNSQRRLTDDERQAALKLEKPEEDGQE